MAIAGGIPCDVDPLLYNVMKNHCGKMIVVWWLCSFMLILRNWQVGRYIYITCMHMYIAMNWIPPGFEPRIF
jgi:hypothetical protein